MALRAPSDDVQRVIALALDAAFYRSAYAGLPAASDPLSDYARAGWREGRDPAPWFSVRRYLEANGDVAGSGAEPLHHYLTVGRYEGREVYPSEHASAWFAAQRAGGEAGNWSFETLAAPVPVSAPAPAAEPIAVLADAPAPAVSPLDEREFVAAEFDAAYYAGVHPDVAEAGTDPLEHFLLTGWREGRDPAPWFSVRDYLELYPDVGAAGMNPFVHYLKAGRAEGRSPRHDLGFRYEILTNLVPVEARVSAARRASAAVALDDAATLAAALATSRSGLKDLHVTFSHDDYTANLGGVQLCLQREDAAIAALGRDHLHLHPAKFWPVVRTGREAGALGVVWNGKPVGAYAPKVVAEALGKAAGQVKAGKRSFAIHSLLGHSAAETAKILAAAGLKAGFFWLHDFGSLCAGFHLLRDDVEDCAAPPPESPACSICVYGPWRARHLSEHERLFKALDLTVVSPSASALELWSASWSFPAKAQVVVPHVRLEPRGPAPAERGKRPFRLAFAGVAGAHKGWPVFRDLALRFANDPRYEFIHLGWRTVGGLPIRFEPVTVTAQDPAAMQRAIAAAGADAVLVWPLCRETFSFTAHEAAAAGAAVVTNPDSGNVAAFVAEGGHGLVLEGEDALASLFESGEIRKLGRARRKAQLYDMTFSGMTADLLAPETGR
jgi:hypothetical protein